MKDIQIPSFRVFKESAALGFGTNPAGSYSIGNSRKVTGYQMEPIVFDIDSVSEKIAKEAMTYEADDDPNHKGDEYLQEAKDLVCNKIDEKYQHMSEGIQEAKGYDVKDKQKQLKHRSEQNLDRYKAAQKRRDNYGIRYYELRMKLDDLDKEKLKVWFQINDLKRKFGKLDG